MLIRGGARPGPTASGRVAWHWRVGRTGEVRASDGVLDELLAVPKEMGGPGGDRTNPEQLVAAGYASGFHNGLRLIGGQQKVKLGESTVRSTVSLIALDNGGFSLKVALAAHLPGLEATV
ncbi:OsmC family protein [Kitasatospora azatica]|uniref:hypothetical protein n=1 Tax=Kitasatospora azatica TaxID=58347 RepID=UPI000A80EF9A|nr:hypothetical protein [Kitasatospora azatica]